MSKYLGLDLGSVTCGVSFSETGFIASTVKTIRFKPDDYDTAMDRVLEVVEEMKPDVIVLGPRDPARQGKHHGPRFHRGQG